MLSIRSNYNSNSSFSADNPFNATILGVVYQQETFIEIQWGWIAAPLILLIGSVTFVIAAIISSSGFGLRQKPEAWKSSILPILKALSAELHQEGLSGTRTLSAMENWAQDVPVRLSRDVDGSGWKLLRRWSNDRDPESQEM